MANDPQMPEWKLLVEERLVDEPALRDYHLLPSVRGDLLAKLGRTSEAHTEFERVALMTRNARERDLLIAREGMQVTQRAQRELTVTAHPINVRPVTSAAPHCSDCLR
jgi:predicted RNA polymerase sigma factor